jgi:ADP-dependent NAD(P)H-hydrate dehydratase / NAD(P)H-hydrate epimerase
MRLPARLLPRKKDSCKNDFGHIFILAGSANMLGAASLCAKSALRSGSGLVTVGVVKSLNKILQKKLPDEIMTRPLAQTADGTIALSAFTQIKDSLKKVDALVIGPGLSQQPSTQKLIRKLVYAVTVPMVIDADGLNALAGHIKEFRGIKVLTPHPGEMARLTGATIQKVQKQRKGIAKALARKYNCIVVLKGRGTVVADSAGRIYVNKTGNPGMATAGSGDVLSGMIAAFLGQGVQPFEAAKTAVYLHGLAGDLAAKEKTQLGLIASDIIENIPRAIKGGS